MSARAASAGVVLDTCVFSFLWRGRPEGDPYKKHLEGVFPALAFATVGELLQGAYHDEWPARRIADLEEHISRHLILPYDVQVARQWARIQTAIRGRTFPANDAWIAACAIAFDIPLLTHNRKDFEHMPGLEMISYS